MCEEYGIDKFSQGKRYDFVLGLNSLSGEVYCWGVFADHLIGKSLESGVNMPTKVKNIKNADGVYSCASVGYIKCGDKIYIIS